MSTPVTVNYQRATTPIPPGRTVLYAATGSGQLSVYIGNDGDPNVTVYIEFDGYISDPIPGNVGTGSPLSLTFNSYLVVYADNLGYSSALAPSIVVTGQVTPPAPAPTQTAQAAFFGLDLSAFMSMLFNMLFLIMFAKMFQLIAQAIGRAS